MQEISHKRLAPILGILGALGPFAIDMYLPGMPQIASDLAVDAGAVQFSLMTFFAGLMIGQLFYGPLSDRIGRKRMIYAGLTLFIIASLACALATTAGQLAGWRFVQGLGGSIGMVIGLAMIRDLYTGRAATGLVALMMVVQGVAPIIAPFCGTAILAVAPWQALFVVLALYGVICAMLTAMALPETRLPELRAASHPSAALRNYLHLLVSRHFISFASAAALAMGGFFAYLAGSSFVFISVYGLSPTAYSLIFAVNAFGLMAGAQIAPRLLGRFRAQSIIRAALSVYTTAALSLVALEWFGSLTLAPFSVLLFIVMTAMAFVMPLGSVMALESCGAIAGTAAALMGALNFGAGTLASLAVGAAADGSSRPMLVAIAVCSLIACLIAFRAFPRTGHSSSPQT
ncbi:Bcr/CflA family efflux transporter OS=Castellaniella defragrans (strain DSM / CCUG 39792 / 65Phen)OX=1437824 GN=BN940_05781 PE=3 SV=1 [Castellaniella denitrificans]|uniref:multidrug effflux MFS transporter n=1 Tax=Castellaniella sp. TaxID=1955812 RepID=UPI002AFE65C9|nr:multidrug effflux MFS transporter [Castellaniella sp.]